MANEKWHGMLLGHPSVVDLELGSEEAVAALDAIPEAEALPYVRAVFLTSADTWLMQTLVIADLPAAGHSTAELFARGYQYQMAARVEAAAHTADDLAMLTLRATQRNLGETPQELALILRATRALPAKIAAVALGGHDRMLADIAAAGTLQAVQDAFIAERTASDAVIASLQA